MTVQELVEKLMELPQCDMEVIVPSDRRDYRFYAVEGASEIEVVSDSDSESKRVICISSDPDRKRWQAIHNNQVANYWKREIVWGLYKHLGIAYTEDMEFMPVPEIVKLVVDTIMAEA